MVPHHFSLLSIIWHREERLLLGSEQLKAGSLRPRLTAQVPICDFKFYPVALYLTLRIG